MSALILTLECAPTNNPHRQIEAMGRMARRDEMLVCAPINGVFVSVSWEYGSVQEAKDKYDRDYGRLPDRKRRFSVINNVSAAWFVLGAALLAKGLMA